MLRKHEMMVIFQGMKDEMSNEMESLMDGIELLVLQLLIVLVVLCEEMDSELLLTKAVMTITQLMEMGETTPET